MSHSPATSMSKDPGGSASNRRTRTSGLVAPRCATAPATIVALALGNAHTRTCACSQVFDLRHLLLRCSEAAQDVNCVASQQLAGLGQPKRATHPCEQRGANGALERPHLLADRRL